MSWWRLTIPDSGVPALSVSSTFRCWPPVASLRVRRGCGAPSNGLPSAPRSPAGSQRGVKVRLIVDDLILQGHDQLIANLHAALGDAYQEAGDLRQAIDEYRKALTTRLF